MMVTNIIFSFLYATGITAVFTLIFKKNGPWDGFWLLFILLFLAAIAAGRWVTAIGPTAWGFHWLPGFIAALLFALLVAAATPDPKITFKNKVDEQTEVNTLAVNFFFIILFIILIVLAVSGLISYNS